MKKAQITLIIISLMLLSCSQPGGSNDGIHSASAQSDPLPNSPSLSSSSSPISPAPSPSPSIPLINNLPIVQNQIRMVTPILKGDFWMLPSRGISEGLTISSPTQVVGQIGGIERSFWHRALSFKGPNSPSWNLRVGKGGQIYFLSDSNLGSLIGPQQDVGEWIDRVIQWVGVSTAKNSPTNPYFIHQAGTYKEKESGKQYFSPLLVHQDKEEGVMTTTWPQQAHEQIKTMAHRSDVLLQTYLINRGRGILEVVYIVNNYGNDTLNFTNVPWMATRHSPTPHTAISTTNRGWVWGTASDWSKNVLLNSTTNGWLAHVKQNTFYATVELSFLL